MARPKDSDSNETWDRIMAATAAVLDAEGVGDLTLRKVAKEAGVSTGTVTYYFKSKDELLEKYLDRFYTGLRKLIEELFALVPTFEDRSALIAHAVKRFHAHYLENRQALIVRLDTRMHRGELPPHVQRRYLDEYSGQGAAMLASLTGVDETRARFTIRTTTFLIARYVQTSDSELEFALGPDVTQQEVGEHIAEVALRLLGLEPPRP